MITLTNIYKRYDHTEVLRGVSMEVKRGEVAVILGPSGGGKSTLLRTINGLETFDAGQIQVDDVVAIAPGGKGTVYEYAAQRNGPKCDPFIEIRRRVGMVFQQFNLFPHRSVLQNVIEAPVHVLGKSRDQAVSDARTLLERVGLADKIDAMPANLSGGQQQRVAIARALAMNPEAILFDEPTSALDPRMTGEVVAVITDLARSGQTMIVVTHAMGFARNIAHTVHVMHAGTIAESGPPEQVFDAPREEVTRGFLAQTKVA